MLEQWKEIDLDVHKTLMQIIHPNEWMHVWKGWDQIQASKILKKALLHPLSIELIPFYSIT